MINNAFGDREPWQIAAVTCTATLSTIWLWNFLCQDETLYKRGKKQLFKLARRYVPSIRKKVQEQCISITQSFEKEFIGRIGEVPFLVQLPDTGLSDELIMDVIKTHVEMNGGFNWKAGLVSGTVYRVDDNLSQLMGKVYTAASYTNPLHPDVFTGICKLEGEVVRIACRLFHGDEETCGTMTTGGTESILLACKTYRDYAREVKGIKKPEIVMPVTAHAAFEKAAQFLNIKMRIVPVNEHSFTVSIKAMKSMITRNTIMLVGSAPNFPYGTMDNIEAISELGVKYNIPVHVDACLGGFLICFMAESGYPLPPFDFRLPGVTSISADTHKYGYAPKGSSLILYRNKNYRHYQYTISTDWPGGIYGSPTINGSRSGGVIAACWATLMHFGHNGYVESTKKILQTAKYVEKRLREIDEIFIFGTPVTSVIAIGSNVFHIYRLAEFLRNEGWNLNTLQFPCSIHICLTHVHTKPGVAEKLLKDVKAGVLKSMHQEQDQIKGEYAIYGMSQTIPDRSLVGDFTKFYLDSMYYTREHSMSCWKEYFTD
ncbi:Sphingosine-1-phosphate lyase [Ooceraea biroi]|uniref:sphinganine-1-phosphate aldolase n=2 Tax=Ooceraea biroi TaxID=2015173 RepID=A0A026WTF5_OOCBI|nr:Sphingosine-1-phosphate lyase [Ooceraea biroi]